MKGLKGIINSSDLLRIIKRTLLINVNEAEYFICGPTEMMDNVKRFNGTSYKPKQNSHRAFYGSCSSRGIIPEGIESNEIKDRKIQIILDGEEHTVEVPAGTSVSNE